MNIGHLHRIHSSLQIRLGTSDWFKASLMLTRRPSYMKTCPPFYIILHLGLDLLYIWWQMSLVQLDMYKKCILCLDVYAVDGKLLIYSSHEVWVQTWEKTIFMHIHSSLLWIKLSWSWKKVLIKGSLLFSCHLNSSLLSVCVFRTYSELDMDLLCWGSGELGQTGHGRPGDISPEEAHLREFTVARLGEVKLMACGSSHSIVVTGTAYSPLTYYLLDFIAQCGCLNAILYFTMQLMLLDICVWVMLWSGASSESRVQVFCHLSSIVETLFSWSTHPLVLVMLMAFIY